MLLVLKKRYLKFGIFIIVLIVIILLYYRLKTLKIYPFSPTTLWSMRIDPLNDSSLIKKNKFQEDTFFYRSYIIDGYIKKDTNSLKELIHNYLDSTTTINIHNKNVSYIIGFYESSLRLDKDYVYHDKEPQLFDFGFSDIDLNSHLVAEVYWRYGKLNYIIIERVNN